MDRRDPHMQADRLVAEFARWAASERASQAALSRSRERWLRQQAAEEATMAGVLLDLAERGDPVTVATATRQYAGRVAALARDFCVLADRGGVPTFVALDRLTVIRPGPGGPPGVGPRGVDREHAPFEPGGSRRAPLDLTLAEALGVLGADRQPVRLDLVGGGAVAGDLDTVGGDLIAVRLPAAHRPRVYIALAAIEACTLA